MLFIDLAASLLASLYLSSTVEKTTSNQIGNSRKNIPFLGLGTLGSGWHRQTSLVGDSPCNTAGLSFDSEGMEGLRTCWLFSLEINVGDDERARLGGSSSSSKESVPDEIVCRFRPGSSEIGLLCFVV